MLSAWAWGTYIFFAVFLAGGFVWVFLVLPETKGATLEEMDKVFGSHTGEADAVLLAEAREAVGMGNMPGRGVNEKIEGNGEHLEKN